MLNIRNAGGRTLVINETNVDDLERLLTRLDDIALLEGRLHEGRQ